MSLIHNGVMNYKNRLHSDKQVNTYTKETLNRFQTSVHANDKKSVAHQANAPSSTDATGATVDISCLTEHSLRLTCGLRL